jgi:biotin transport system substrate-specific component
MNQTLALSWTKPLLNDTPWVKNTVLVITGSLFLALMAQLSVPLPFSPVPITGQTLGVLLVGALLGSWRGASAVGLYLLEGAMGFPVFAGGSFGFMILMGPTGGYLMGFVLGAWVIGFLCEKKWDRNIKTALAAFILGQTIIFALGLFWLSFFVGTKSVLLFGFWPFLPGAVYKTFLATFILPTAWKFSR